MNVFVANNREHHAAHPTQIPKTNGAERYRDKRRKA